MNSRTVVASMLSAFMLTAALHARAADAPDSAGELSIAAVLEKYSLYADHCESAMPALKLGFIEVMKSLKSRIHDIGEGLLDSDKFKDMKQAAPPVISAAIAAELDNTRSELADQDPAAVCPDKLQSYQSMTDEALSDFLKRTMAGIQSTIRMLDANK